MASGVVVFGPRGFRRSKYPRTFHTDVTESGTPASLVETTLASTTLPGGLLIENGQGIKFRAFGTTAANANNKQIRLKFGGTTVFDTGALSVNNVDWMFEAEVRRTGSATQIVYVTGWWNTGYTSDFTTAAVDLTGEVIVSVTGQNGTAAANDIVCKGFVVEYLPSGDGS